MAPDNTGPELPRVFLSSTYREVPAGETSLRHFAPRRALWELGRELRIPIWVHEFEPRGSNVVGDQDPSAPTQEPHWTQSIPECLEELSRSDLLIVLLGRRAGTRVEMDALGKTASSVFEVELFYASQWKIPVVFYEIRGYEPGPELVRLIDILRLKDGRNWHKIDEREVRSSVASLLAALRSVATGAWRLPYFQDHLSDERSARNPGDEIQSDRLSFIGRPAFDEGRGFDAKRFQRLGGLADGAASNLASRLGFLWMALRELASGGWRPDLADTWIELCGRWTSASAWTGLHGPVNTGVLAAFQTRNDVLRRTGRSSADDKDFPFGPFASELYSTGLLSGTPSWKRRRFSAAAKLATRHAARSGNNPSGALAIRASAQLRLAELGRPWLAFSALADYRSVHRIRDRIGAGPSAIGEALSEWGFAEFQVRRRLHIPVSSALRKMREGVQLMADEPGLDPLPFLVRGQRKLARALLEAGQRDEGEAVSRDAEALARSHGILGQLRRNGN